MGSCDGTPTQVIRAHLKAHGHQSAVVPAKLVPTLYQELEGLVEKGEISPELLVEGYLYGLATTPPEIPNWARSLVIVSMAQPIGRFRFEHEKGITWAIVPPQYRENQDVEVEEILMRTPVPGGIRTSKARVPLKLVAVRSGLAEYGRNNITYTRENGSFHRLAAFYVNFPCEEIPWDKKKVMESCSSCDECLKHCPTGCIRAETFLVRGEKCLTFHSESNRSLPDWVDPAWMNALVGCMRCQSICPENKAFLSRIETWETFSRYETAALMAARVPEQIPGPVSSKLERWGLEGYLKVLGRNLDLLVNRRRQPGFPAE